MAVRGAAPGRLREPADSERRGDGLELRDAYVTAVVRCAPPANKPTPGERDECLDWLAEELRLLGSRPACCSPWARSPGTGRCARCARSATRRRARGRVSATAPRRRSGPYRLLGSYHPSQQNTFTGKLTREMLDGVIARARGLAGA